MALAFALLALPSPGSALKEVGNECDAGLEDPCDAAAHNESHLWLCDKVDTQLTVCTRACAKESDECDAYAAPGGSELQCLIVETGAETGLCAEISILWIIGVSLSLAGSLISNFGMQIQKLAFNKHEKDVNEGKTERKIPFCLPMWVAGFSGMVTGSLLDFVSLAFAAQSLLAPLAASTLVINIVQAPLIVKEKLSTLDFFCTIVIATGCVFAVGFADHDTKTYSLQEMLDLWQEMWFLLWIVVVLAFMFAAFLMIRKGHLPADPDNPDPDIAKKSRIEMSETNWYPFLLAALGGQSGGNSILFAKSLSEVCKTVIQVGISFGDLMIAFLMAGGLFCCMFIQLKYMNQGLRYFDVLFVLPVYQAFWIAGATMNGILFFEEYNNFNDSQYIFFPLGCFLTISGVAALAFKYEQTGGRHAKAEAEVQEQLESEERDLQQEVSESPPPAAGGTDVGDVKLEVGAAQP